MQLRELDGKRILIWGAGREGAAAVEVLERHCPGAQLSVVAGSSGGDLLGIVVQPESALPELLDGTDIVLRSPGVSAYRPELKGRAVVTGTSLWMAESKGERVIAVTGTKGKSTTASLIAHFLQALAKTVELAGNIGRPVIELFDVPTPDVYVLELSSFQTAGLTDSPQVGVVTGLSPEHLDWHGDVSHYYDDKLNLLAWRSDGTVVVDGGDSEVKKRLGGRDDVCEAATRDAAHVQDGKFFWRTTELFATDISPLLGAHNALNVCLALSAVAASGIDVIENAPALAEALKTFEALPHRLQPVIERDGVLWVDDGLATNVAPTMAALRSFDDRPITVLIGGYDRGVDLSALIAYLAATANLTVITMPVTGDRVADALEAWKAGPSVYRTPSLREAVSKAHEITKPGGVVLLSPAASSFGAFENYIARSAAYAAAIMEVIG